MSAASVKPVALPPDAGIAVENPTGGVMTFKLLGHECGGVLTAIEGTASPGEGPPLHVHEQDELIYTLEGTY